MKLWMSSMSKKQASEAGQSGYTHPAIEANRRLAEQLQNPLSAELVELLQQAKMHEKWPLARLISIFERNTEANFIARHQLMAYLNAQTDSFSKHGLVLGITGTPGAGKSSLIGALCLDLLAKKPDISIAVLAIDPSSHESGGALLGDRTRTIFPVKDKRLFFRSQASQQDLGGLSKQTFHVTRLLRKLFDLIIIETVGIGQNEIEIQKLSDHSCLVMQPLAGDQVQFMKAGIMEVPNTFIINKCDEDVLAKKSLHLLKASLKLAQIHIHGKESSDTAQTVREIFLTSAIKKKGINELAGFILSLCNREIEPDSIQQQETYFLHKWIRQAYGEFGMAVFQHLHADEALKEGSMEQKELRFKQLISGFLTHVSETITE
jgi:LAO/AO transport system kinase